jgi:gamma-glutamyl:cysteine ligase YbdK (ATP-grasp superfamily)
MKLVLASGADYILSEIQNSFYVKEKLLDSIIQFNTSVCKNLNEVISNLTKYIQKASNVAESKGYSLVSIAIHPFLKRKEQFVTQNDRYLYFLNRMQWSLRLLLFTGVHIYVGVVSGGKTIVNCLGCQSQVDALAEIAENNVAPYQRQIRTYQKNDDFTDFYKMPLWN